MLHTANTFTTLKSVKITFSKEKKRMSLETLLREAEMYGLKKKKKTNQNSEEYWLSILMLFHN